MRATYHLRVTEMNSLLIKMIMQYRPQPMKQNALLLWKYLINNSKILRESQK